jgi:hypothetical protein
MNVPAPAWNRWPSLVAAFVVVLASSLVAQSPIVSGAAQTAPTPQMLPGQYLDTIGQQVKARWRQLYRNAPPVLSSERMRMAFTLGGLMADSHLAVQAGDAQQFRNNNQEVQKFLQVLGLSAKITPDVNAGSQMAESGNWPALRQQVQQTQQHIEAALIDQRDEDLAILVDLGLWMRLFDMGTTLVSGAPNVPDKTISIGSLPTLNELVDRFEHLTEVARTDEAVALVGGVLEMLQRHWTAAQGQPADEVVQMTHDKVRFVIGKVEAK